MLTKISFNAGSSLGKPGLEFALSPVTIFVGPNNSGKSRALIEIEGWVTRAQGPEGQVIKQLEFEPWDRAAFESEVAKIEVQPALSETVNPDHVLLAKLRPQDNSAARVQINREALFNDATNPNGKHRHHYANYLALYTLRLDGRNRLSLTDDKPSGDLLKVAPNHLAKLFIDDTSRKEVRRIVFEAFGKHLVVDPTNIGQLRLRFSSTAPANDREEQGWDQAAQEFHPRRLAIERGERWCESFCRYVDHPDRGRTEDNPHRRTRSVLASDPVRPPRQRGHHCIEQYKTTAVRRNS